MLTGKAKEGFEKHYLTQLRKQRKDYNKYSDEVLLKKFYRKTVSEKYGVYVDYFDNLKVYIIILEDSETFDVLINDEWIDTNLNTRHEARIQAIKKANEIINNR